MEPNRLDGILRAEHATIVPGVYDALSARVAARAGARALYMTGLRRRGSELRRPRHRAW
ncbi:MAG: hypothetical protein WDM81_14395 [Rhizomicrobium sp.]